MSISAFLTVALPLTLLSVSNPVCAQYQFDPSPSEGEKVANLYCRNLAYRFAEREAYSGILQGATRGAAHRTIFGGILGRSPSKVAVLGSITRATRQSETWRLTYRREYSN